MAVRNTRSGTEHRRGGRERTQTNYRGHPRETTMSALNNLKVQSKLLLLASVFALGLAVFALYAYDTMNNVKVNGPVYARIGEGKDLIADVLPPPAYLVEAYLVVLQMEQETDAGGLMGLAERSKELGEEDKARHEY